VPIREGWRVAGREGLALAVLVAVVLAAAGCFQRVERVQRSPSPTVVQPAPSLRSTPEPSSGISGTPEPSPPVSPSPEGRPTLVPTVSGPGRASTPAVTPVQRYGLFLEIEGLSDESVVRGDTVVARGRTRPDAVLSINGVVIPVGPDGSFEVLLALNPGPNVIEVVASDLSGNQTREVLALVSLPEEAP